MLGFSHLEIIRKLILLITGILIGYTCLTFRTLEPFTRAEVDFFKPYTRIEAIPIILRQRAAKTVFHCIGIAVIGGVLFYILGDKKERRD